MEDPRLWPTVLCMVLFAVTAALFVATGRQRRRLDAFLGTGRTQQLGMFTEWSSSAMTALAVPERRWNYGQDYMIAFITAIAVPMPVPGNGHRGASGDWLGFYAGAILNRDIGFAAAFAAFIVAAAFAAATWMGGYAWPMRTAIIVACMGIVYGAADIAEDLMLKRILDAAQRTLVARRAGKAVGEPADAAEVDAANVLTRLKLLSLLLSGVGLIAFGVLVLADALAGKLAPIKSEAETARSGTV